MSFRLLLYRRLVVSDPRQLQKEQYRGVVAHPRYYECESFSATLLDGSVSCILPEKAPKMAHGTGLSGLEESLATINDAIQLAARDGSVHMYGCGAVSTVCAHA